MLSRRNLTQVCLLLAALAITYSQALQSFAPFSDSLTLNTHYGDSIQVVEHLGRMIKLQTAVAHHNIFPCTFTIQTRTTEMPLAFKPDRYCLLGICGDYKFDLQKLALSGFDPKRRTIILVAGFMSGEKVDWIDRMAKMWLAIEDVNVIKVGWADGNSYVYVKAVSGTPIVARQITILLHHLTGLNGYSFTDVNFAKRVQIIGHSLGAHIAGFVGQDLGGRLGRITGLDPAGVYFDIQPRELRLDPTDAKLVDVIHTSGGKFHYHNFVMSSPSASLDWFMDKVPMLSTLHSKIKTTLGEGYSREANTTWFGIDQQVGHVDFYANNGKVQPECDSYLHICDHGRSSEIYLDLLEHEYDMLQWYGAQFDRRESRLLAFKAEDYDSFFVGANLAKTCRPILEVGKGRNIDQFSESMWKCSLPIDVVGQVDDVIREYSTQYGLAKVFERPQELSGDKFFFSTRGSHPLVGDQMLLKIYPSRVLDSWSPSCLLRAKFTMPPYNLISRTTMLKDPTKPFGINKIVGGPLVFTAVFTTHAVEPIVSKLRSLSASNETKSEINKELRNFLPAQIELSASSTGVSHSPLRAAAKKAWSYFSVKSGGLSKCTMMIQSVEVIPLIPTEHAFMGRYENLGIGDVLSADQELPLHLASVQFE